ncbi:MAG TPA: SRPBCC family protein [Candidatus Thermoplasmatota archaeon]
MGTVRFEIEVTLGAPPSAVAPFLMDHDKLPRWIPEIVSSKADDEGGPRVGAKYTQVWNFGGREQTLNGEVTQCEPPSRYAYRATVGKNVYSGRFELAEEPEGKTKLKYAEESQVVGLAGLLLPLMKGAIRRRTAASLDRLRSLVEA